MISLNKEKSSVSDELKEGDKVEWNSAQGKIKGTVKKKLTEPTEIQGHHVAASPENPQYLIESDKTGKAAAHKPEALRSTQE
jgi:Hypervirulence associated proteins TUDOR domain